MGQFFVKLINVALRSSILLIQWMYTRG